MARENNPYVCPVALSGSLDNFLRKLVHKPQKILEPYIRKGMIVLDLGCGPGYFTAGMARLVGEEGRVIAADIQQGMLNKVTARITGTDIEKIVEIHNCQSERIGITRKVDFVLAFWMVHEVPDKQRMFEELRSLLNPGGSILIIEPKFHVSKKSFEKTVILSESARLEVIERPKVPLSRSVLLSF